jgi:hypothetical protein
MAYEICPNKWGRGFLAILNRRGHGAGRVHGAGGQFACDITATSARFACSVSSRDYANLTNPLAR